MGKIGYPRIAFVSTSVPRRCGIATFTADLKAAVLAAAAAAITSSGVDVVNLQHEFGLYGTWEDGVFTDHRRPFLGATTPPESSGNLSAYPPR